MTEYRILQSGMIPPGHLRIRVEVGDQHTEHDYPVSSLPGWIHGLEAGAERLERGCIKSAMTAREMAMIALEDGDADLAGIAALWVVLFGPSQQPEMTLSQIMEVANCMITVRGDATGRVWHASVARATPITRH
jgi:hypothetical protein